MRTEEQIVYELLNIYHGGQVSNDNVVSERLVRSFLRKHRARRLELYFNNGLSVSDECFQYVGNLYFEKTGDFYECKIPAVIHLGGYGIMLSKNNVEIPIMDRTSFRSSLKNVLNKYFPKATISGNTLIAFPGTLSSCKIPLNSEIGSLMVAIEKEIASFNDNEKFSMDLDAVLYDPSSAKDYDWTKDPYPCPSEIIDHITTATTQKDLGLMLRQYIDDNVNSRADKTEPNETA